MEHSIFEELPEDYDEMRDLQYGWYFSRLHYLITKHVICGFRPESVLDVACGTGLQSHLYACGGARVTGVDISKILVDQTKNKNICFSPADGLRIFPIHLDFVRTYNKKIAGALGINKNSGLMKKKPTFSLADARKLPFGKHAFDHVNMVGALSFIERYPDVLSEIKRVLKSGGTLFIEVENRWNMDILWRGLNSLLDNRLGYNTTSRDFMRLLFSRPTESVSAGYPFILRDKVEDVKARYFTFASLTRELKKHGFSVLNKWSIHSVTNVLPITYLGRDYPPPRRRKIFSLLSFIEERFPFYLPGLTLVVLAKKQ